METKRSTQSKCSDCRAERVIEFYRVNTADEKGERFFGGSFIDHINVVW